MKSRTPRPSGLSPFTKLLNCTTPGPLGKNDYADPLFWIRAGLCRLFGDTPGPLGVNDHARPLVGPPVLGDLAGKKAPASASPPEAAGPLQVTQGQVTFDAEGNDTSTSPYFSRKVHWPGNAASGVTLGRGYDMGNRTEAAVTADLVAAGLSQEKAREFAKGAQKKGESAKKFVTDNKESLDEISHEVQKNLFERVYPDYIERAKKNYNKWTKDASGVAFEGKVEWDDLHWAIRDILVDFVYQGFTKGPNPMVKGMKNDFDELIKYIEGSTVLQHYEAGRGRVDYLKANRNK